MRSSSIIIAVIVAVTLGLGCGEVLAKAHQVPSMAAGAPPRPDFAQFQAELLEWLRLTVTSTQFIVGTVLGVILAEAGRFLWHWGRRFFGVAALSLSFVIRHRLLTAGLGAAVYYVAVFRPLG